MMVTTHAHAVGSDANHVTGSTHGPGAQQAVYSSDHTRQAFPAH